jgi:hypothetical protein
MNKIVYANLGTNSGERNIYIRSTDIEQKNWESLLMSFPDEALYFMTQGKSVVIIDKCNKKQGKVQKVFCPAFTDFLRKIRCEQLKYPALQDHTRIALQAYRANNSIYRKYEFFKYKLRTLNVRGRTIFMEKEPSVWRKEGLKC